MPRFDLLRESRVIRSARVMQMEGLFDVSPAEKSRISWSVDFELPEKWNIGLIIGPSGSGKTTFAREVFGDAVVSGFAWDDEKSILDGFPPDMPISEITGILSSVGFSSPPAWLRPFRALSNGKQFRVTLARALAEKCQLAVVDEFTSVVDRTVAKIGSAAVEKAVRRRGGKFVAVSCHYDIVEWLRPDWIFEPHANVLTLPRGSLRRPDIQIEIVRAHSSAWRLFKHHHYLSADLHRAAKCFVALWKNFPVAFSAVLFFPHAISPGWREHRTVCLPDFQGVGIGNAVSDFVASMFAATGKPYRSTTSSPAFVRARQRSKNWKMTSRPKLHKKSRNLKTGLSDTNAWNRFTASFEYVGPVNSEEARKHGIIR